MRGESGEEVLESPSVACSPVLITTGVRAPNMNTDSAAALRVALLVAGSLLLRECLCAPAARGDARPAWQWPCGERSPAPPGMVLVPGEPVRHRATKAMRRVKNQLAVSSEHMNYSQRAIRRLYGNFSTFGESQFQYDWLPRQQRQWYKKHKQCSRDKIAEVLPVFHRSLQNFSVTFEAMKITGNSQIGEKEELYSLRDSLLSNITTWHKMLHCETETAIHNMRLPVPEWASVDILTEDKWPSNPDLTHTLMRDWGVISRYETFLSEWASIIRLLGKKDVRACKGEGGAAGSKLKPRRSRPK